MEKHCKICNETKPIELFSKHNKTKDGLQSKCKSCSKEYFKKYREINRNRLNDKLKDFYNLNKKEINDVRKLKYLENSDEIKNKSSIYYNNNKPKIKLYYMNYRNINKKKLNEYNKKYINEKRRNDSLFKLKMNIRSIVSSSIYKKRTKTIEIIGCSFEEFKTYLESKFEPWMTWDNYGLYNGKLNHGWDIDHIIPISSAKTEDNVVKLNHYTNLQPLCGYTNRYIKKNKII
jgi:hypothetical protein